MSLVTTPDGVLVPAIVIKSSLVPLATAGGGGEECRLRAMTIARTPPPTVMVAKYQRDLLAWGYPGGVLPVTPVTRPINIGFSAWCTREQTRAKACHFFSERIFVCKCFSIFSGEKIIDSGEASFLA
jgi:hypothetical protein